MTDRGELGRLADKVRDWTPENRNPLTFIAHERRLIVTALRRLASSDSGVKGEPEPVAWQWRCCIGGNWGAWLELDQPVEQFRSGRWAFNLKNGTAELRALYTAPPADAGMREALQEAYIAGATAVHNEWVAATERGDGPPRGEPDFSEAASDYATLTAPGATTKSDGGEERPASNPLSEVTHRPSDPKTSPELLALLERAKSHVMTPEDVYEQRRSFVRGMCPSDRDYTEWCADVDRIIPPLAGPSDTRPADVTVDEPRCDCGHLFEICDAPNCNRALLDTYKIGAK